jgi:hypothetical protein
MLRDPFSGGLLNFASRPGGDLMIHDFYLPNTTLSVVFDPATDEYRLILLSGCTSMCVCLKCKCTTFINVLLLYL